MSLFKSGIIVAFFTLISRIFGLIRELFIASMFGTSMVADCVNVAFKLPNLFRRIFAEGALSSVFIPLYNERLNTSGNEAKKFAENILSWLCLILCILISLMLIFMPKLMFIIAPGFISDEFKFNLAVTLCRITMPYLLFVSIVSLYGGILNSVGKFMAFSASPVIMNIVIILGTKIMGNLTFEYLAICYSVILAGVFQVGFMLPQLSKERKLYLPQRPVIDSDIKIFLDKIGPAILSSGFMQINLFISQSIASFAAGAVSIIAYAERLYQFPLSIIGIAFGTVLLPTLSKMYSQHDQAKIFEVQNNAIQIGLLLAIPCAVGAMILAHPIIHIIYERGEFNSQDTIATAQTLMGFLVGLPAFILLKIFTPIFYAHQDTKTPMRITLYSICINTALNISLMPFFQHFGIAIGTSIAAWFNIWLLYKNAKSMKLIKITSATYKIISKIIFATLMMVISIQFFKSFWADYYFSETLIIKVTFLALTIILAMFIYFAVAILSGATSLSIKGVFSGNTKVD